MGFSQNARFALELEDSSAEDHPRGTSLAIDLSRALDSTGWAVSEPDNWRDVGWSFSAYRDGVELEVILSAIEDGEWILQLGPARGAGLVAKVLGRRPSASPHDCFVGATILDEALESRCTSIAWRWNGLPSEETSTSEPQECESAR